MFTVIYRPFQRDAGRPRRQGRPQNHPYKNNPKYKSVDGVLFYENGETLQRYPINKSETSYNIPDGVKSIGERAFEGCENIENIIIPSSVANIEDYAFSYCNAIESINIPHGTLSLGRYVFNNCSNLKTVNISDSVTSIGTHAFEDCWGLMNIDVDKKNHSYQSENGVLFYFADKNGKILIYYPAGKTEKSYKIPDDVSEVGDSAFKSSNLLEVYVPGQVNSIGPKAFIFCNNLKTVTISEGVNSIENYAFWGCGFDSVEVPETVNSIGKSAFGGCENLKVVYFENKDIEIDLDWFKGSDNLTSIFVANQKQDF